jgi:hypothetical protein
MKIKLLGTLSLSAFLLMSGCGGSANTNTNANANANKPVSTPAPANAMASGNDGQVKTKIEENWKAKGCTGATVDVKEGVATGRGTVPKGKLGECVMAAQEAKPGKFENQLTEAK